ncbi:hypothetical protein BD408DRAFT_416282, partial [Parasitella parasitica]
MKFSVLSSFIFLLISAAFFIQSSNALSQPSELTALHNNPRRNVASYLAKRKTSSKPKSCDGECPLKLPSCPKDCPQTCGYKGD